MSLLVRVSLFFCLFVSRVSAVSLIEEDFNSLVTATKDIVLVQIVSAEVNMEGEKFCGINYSAVVKQVVKGAWKTARVSFATSETLPVLEKFVIFLNEGERASRKQKFFLSTSCQSKSLDWYFWGQLGKRVFPVDEKMTAIQKAGDVIAVDKYAFKNSSIFISPFSVPEESRSMFSYEAFVFLKDLMK